MENAINFVWPFRNQLEFVSHFHWLFTYSVLSESPKIIFLFQFSGFSCPTLVFVWEVHCRNLDCCINFMKWSVLLWKSIKIYHNWLLKQNRYCLLGRLMMPLWKCTCKFSKYLLYFFVLFSHWKYFLSWYHFL